MAHLFNKCYQRSVPKTFIMHMKRCASFKSFNETAVPSITWNDDMNLDPYRAPENIKYKCHWVIPNKLMMGKSPNNDKELMDALVNVIGIKVFLTLTDGPINNQLSNIEYIHFPMKNFTVASDESTIDLMWDIMDKINKDKELKLYTHCNSGHGRAGVMSALLLQCIYGIEANLSMQYLKLVHTTRCDNNISCNIPEKQPQVDQVKRLHPDMLALYIKYVST